MKKQLTTLLILTLMSLYSFCQTGYPRLMVIDKDTIVALTIPQLKKVNISFVKLDFQKEMNDTLNSIISSYKQAIETQKHLNASYENQISLKNGIIVEDDAIRSHSKKIELKQTRQIKWLKIQRTTFLAATAILVAKILLFK